jgi:hypothetical protein
MMAVVPELGEEPSPAGSGHREPVVRGSIVGLSVAMAVCVIVVLSVVVLLVVQPGKKSAPSQQPGSLCFDSAMQMQMPCSTGP